MKKFKSILKYLIVIVVTVVFTVKITQIFNITELEYVRGIIERYYVDDVEKDVVLDGAKAGMVAALDDKHSYFITSEYGFDVFQSNATGEYAGIGVTITMENENSEYVLVMKASENSPAYKSGIRTGDYIIKADGVDLKGKNTSEVSSVIKGKPGTDVKITVLRDSVEKEFTVTRAKISAESVESKILNGNIGYVKLDQFDSDTDKELDKHISNLGDIKGLVVDLRQNPGGIMNVAISVLDKFLDKGNIIVTAKYKDSETVYKAENKKSYEMPLVVIVDSNSASASEIFASAIKENDRGIIVGTKTYGKGSIQRTFPLPNNEGINLTVGRFYSPDGNTINEVGVEPDVLVELDEEFKNTLIYELELYQDKQLTEALKQFE